MLGSTDSLGASQQSDAALQQSDAALQQSAQSTGGALRSGNPVTVVDGAWFRDLLNAGLAWLDQHHELVNALNVFPVPDGDTGTNMVLTMKSACQEIAPESPLNVGDVAKAAAHGALMGARGNSGVILSQILRGMARSLDSDVILTGPRLATALAEGSRVAYKGVNRPVEGTSLTVVREAANAAERAAAADPDLLFIMAETVDAADAAVADTPRLLPILAQTGKVDSGGKGLFFILEGIHRQLSGLPITMEAPSVTVESKPVGSQFAKGRRDLPQLEYGFDVQFLVEGKSLDVDRIREKITAMGDCPLVEGDETLVKVHVHVPNPGVPLSYAVSLGFVTDVLVENMDDMHLPVMLASSDPVPPRFEASKSASQASANLPPIGIGTSHAAPLDNPEFTRLQELEGPAIIAVASGQGLARVFKSLGAQQVVAGGQTMNPSTRDLLSAIERVAVSEVILLPNNANIIMAAQQAQALTGEGRSVVVVPSRSIPQGISALLALNPHADLEHNIKAMTAALDHVQTGEVTIAIQDARFDGILVRVGDVIGLLNDRLTATASTGEAVVKQLLEQMGASELEIITLYHGQPVTGAKAAALRDELSRLYPNQEIEVVDGGQPFYHYIISAE
jgi:DAK2 domain fusion protein YloV